MLTGIKGKYENLWRMMLLAQMSITNVVYADGADGGVVVMPNVPAPSMPDMKVGAMVVRPDQNVLSAHKQVMAAIPAAAQRMTDKIAMPVRLPTHPTIRAGDVDIRTYGHVTDVILRNNAAINWDSFSVGKGNTFRVRNDIGQGAKTILLNTVTGQDRSVIEGALQSKNSHLWLSNPNGIDIKDGASIDSHFLGTTKLLDIDDFVTGNYNFKGDSHASITLSGKVTMARPGRWIAMAAEHIHGQNDLLLAAPAHRLILGGVEAFSLDLEGDNLYGFKVDSTKASQNLSVQLDAQSKIQADNGYVLVTVQEAVDTAASVINANGLIEATKVDTDPHTGVIHLKGAKGSKVTVGGKLSAAGNGTTGGKVYVEGSDIEVDKALLDVSGDLGGGHIALGGKDLRVIRQDGTRGDGTFMMADNTEITKGTRLKADSIQNGDGGKIELWGTKKLTVKGYAKGDGPSVASVRGGAHGGDGGFAELSTAGTLDVNDKGYIDRTAPHGESGMLFYDPENLYINNQSPVNGSWITPDNLITDLRSGNVTLSTNTTGSATEMVNGGAGVNLTHINNTGTGVIYLSWPLDLQTNSISNKLILQASSDIILSYPLTVGSGDVYLMAGMGGAGIINIETTGSGALTLNGTGRVYAYYTDASLSGAPTSFNFQGTNAATNSVVYRWIKNNVDWAPIANNWSSTRGYNYALLNNITLVGGSDTDISNSGALTGHWDGGSWDQSQRSITINRTGIGGVTTFPSLFSAINNSDSVVPAVQNLTITHNGDYLNSSNTRPVGALVGTLQNGILKNNVMNIGSMTTGGSSVGGLVGIRSGGALENNKVYLSGSISGTGAVGGLIGRDVLAGASMNNNGVIGNGSPVVIATALGAGGAGPILGGDSRTTIGSNTATNVRVHQPVAPTPDSNSQYSPNISPAQVTQIQNVQKSTAGIASIVASVSGTASVASSFSFSAPVAAPVVSPPVVSTPSPVVTAPAPAPAPSSDTPSAPASAPTTAAGKGTPAGGPNSKDKNESEKEGEDTSVSPSSPTASNSDSGTENTSSGGSSGSTRSSGGNTGSDDALRTKDNLGNNQTNEGGMAG